MGGNEKILRIKKGTMGHIYSSTGKGEGGGRGGGEDGRGGKGLPHGWVAVTHPSRTPTQMTGYSRLGLTSGSNSTMGDGRSTSNVCKTKP